MMSGRAEHAPRQAEPVSFKTLSPYVAMEESRRAHERTHVATYGNLPPIPEVGGFRPIGRVPRTNTRGIQFVLTPGEITEYLGTGASSVVVRRSEVLGFYDVYEFST